MQLRPGGPSPERSAFARDQRAMAVEHKGRAPAFRLVLLLAALLALVATPGAAAPKFPPLAGRVTDAAGILPADSVAAIAGSVSV